MLNLRATISDASQSSNCGWLGVPPRVPKSLGFFCSPSPKCHCQSRFTATRANSGFPGAVSQSEKVSNPSSAKLCLGGAKRPPRLYGFFFLGPLGISPGQDIALPHPPPAIPSHGPEGRQGPPAPPSAPPAASTASRLVGLRLQIL